PVAKKRGSSLTEVLVEKFNTTDRMTLAITPEGTRRKVSEWRTGFLHIAYEAKVPIILGAIDAAKKTVHLERTFTPTGDVKADMKSIKAYYKGFNGIKPENFTTE
ncbi:MAG: acyltransferase, partial [Duncaniella sp.]|nr:acyltransferase [Duncaniella sp.]